MSDGVFLLLGKAGSSNDAGDTKRPVQEEAKLHLQPRTRSAKLSILRVLDALAEPRAPRENLHRVPGTTARCRGGEELRDGRWKDTSKTQQNVTEIRRLAALKSDLPERRVHICFHQ